MLKASVVKPIQITRRTPSRLYKPCRAFPEYSLDYLNMFSTFVCKANMQCMNHMILPSIDEQQETVKKFLEVEHSVESLHGLDPLVFKLLISHQDSYVSDLVDYIKYVTEIEHKIDDIINFVNHLPAPINESLNV